MMKRMPRKKHVARTFVSVKGLCVFACRQIITSNDQKGPEGSGSFGRHGEATNKYQYLVLGVVVVRKD
jgi:hypothetical protein